MSYPYGRPGDASGGQSGSGGQWVPVPGSGGRRSSVGVVVGCVVGLVVAALVVGVAFVVVRSRGVEPGETITVVAAYKYVYVGEPVTFVTALEPEDNRYDFPEIVVQPS